MSLLDVAGFMNNLEDKESQQLFENETKFEPKYVPADGDEWTAEFKGFKTNPVFYNLDGYVSPFPENHWGASSEIISSIVEESRFLPPADKIDPNKIFTADINALRNLATDHNKTVRLFERKFLEALSASPDITEELIEAFQAVTAGRSAIVSIAKEKTNIKTKIAELKIKQQQLANQQKGSYVDTNTTGAGGSGNPNTARELLDDIFELGHKVSSETPQFAGATVIDADAPPETFDALIGDSVVDVIPATYERMGAKTYVEVDASSDDKPEFITLDRDGNVIPGYKNPDNSTITKVDRAANRAYDSLMNEYELRIRPDRFVDI